MTKRPRAFVAVATWLGFSILLSTTPLARALTGYIGPDTGAPPGVTIARISIFGLLVLLLVALVQLRPVAIWLCVALAGIHALSTLVNLPILVGTHASGMVVSIAIIASLLSATSAWYLSRPEFRLMAARFRAEREAEAVRRYSERRIRKGVR